MSLLFAFPEQAALAKEMIKTSTYEEGQWEWRHFPDNESYIRVLFDVRNKPVSILCSLNQPDQKTLPLIFLAQTLKEAGAKKITLIAPYLGYMRQDKRFKEGESITSEIFAKLLSSYIDKIITVDPHLHRHERMEEIYSCECKVFSAASLMSEWIASNIDAPLIVGPDRESEQWVRMVAEQTNAPYIVANKVRQGDCEVVIELPDICAYEANSPVLIDDVISTATTMAKTVELLQCGNHRQITCMATHAVFAGKAYENLLNTAAKVVTTNTITHVSNVIDIAPLFTK